MRSDQPDFRPGTRHLNKFLNGFFIEFSIFLGETFNGKDLFYDRNNETRLYQILVSHRTRSPGCPSFSMHSTAWSHWHLVVVEKYWSQQDPDNIIATPMNMILTGWDRIDINPRPVSMKKGKEAGMEVLVTKIG